MKVKKKVERKRETGRRTRYSESPADTLTTRAKVSVLISDWKEVIYILTVEINVFRCLPYSTGSRTVQGRKPF